MTKTEFLKKYEFNCISCGNCCSGESGYIWINETEIENIRKYLKLSRFDFLNKYTKPKRNKITLKEIKIDEDVYDCIFLKNKKCMVYEVRPEQCKTYPFWKNILTDKDYLKFTLEDCCGLKKKSLGQKKAPKI